MPLAIIGGVAGYIFSQDNVLANAYAGTGAVITYSGAPATTFRSGVNTGVTYTWSAYQGLISFDLSAYAHLKGKITNAYLQLKTPSGTFNLVTDHILEFREYNYGTPDAGDWVLPANIPNYDPILFSFDSVNYTPSATEQMVQINPAAIQAISNNLGGTLRMLGSSDDVRLQTALADASYMGFWNEAPSGGSLKPELLLRYEDTAPAGIVC